jgi:voltage-gated potassium channel
MGLRPIPTDLTARRAARAIALATLVISVAGGAIMTLVDRHDFPTVGEGLWFSAQTVTTVGFGDHVPTTTAGRLVAVAVMIAGIALVTVVTAAITAIFVESARRRFGRGEEARLAEIAERLERIERALAER